MATPGRWKQVDDKFKVIFGCIESLRPAWAARKPVLKYKEKLLILIYYKITFFCASYRFGGI